MIGNRKEQGKRKGRGEEKEGKEYQYSLPYPIKDKDMGSSTVECPEFSEILTFSRTFSHSDELPTNCVVPS